MNKKLNVLVVSEFHHLLTGYATYYKNICQALHNAGHKVSELASYGNENIPEHITAGEKCEWDVYLNIPHMSSKKWPEYLKAKESKFDTEFGSWDFENIVLDCWPDVVIAIRDHWYDKFIIDSPLSKYYRVVLSPTIDSMPQRADWLDTFQKVDALTFYTKWSEDWAKEQYNGENIVSHIPPGPNPEYHKIDQKLARRKLGINPDGKILLTVMRNQGRKQYPYLLEALSKLKDKTVKLYCHTHFQDRGWDLPKLLLQYGISDRVYFTYKCKSCYDISADILKSNNKCNKCGAEKEICSVQNGASNEELNFVYNSADLYVQWSSNEGFGIPIIEAAATGLKVILVDYSAPEDIKNKTESIAIQPLSLQRNMGMLTYQAIPHNDLLIDALNYEDTWVYNKDDVISKLKENYDWGKTGQKWVELVESQIPKNCWEKSPDLLIPPQFEQIKHLPIFEFVKVCILNVAQDESLLGSYSHCEVLEHLENGFFIPENKKTGDKSNAQKTVTKEMIYGKFLQILENRIKWEKRKNALLPQKNV